MEMTCCWTLTMYDSLYKLSMLILILQGIHMCQARLHTYPFFSSYVRHRVSAPYICTPYAAANSGGVRRIER